MNRYAAGIHRRNARRCQYNHSLLAIMFQILQESRFARSGLSRQEKMGVGVLQDLERQAHLFVHLYHFCWFIANLAFKLFSVHSRIYMIGFGYKVISFLRFYHFIPLIFYFQWEKNFLSRR